MESLNEVVENPILVAPEPIPDPNTKVLDTPLEKTIQLLGFRVSVIGLQLGHSARLAIHLNCIYDEKPFLEYKELVIEGDEYTAWGADDTYIMELVASKIKDLI